MDWSVFFLPNLICENYSLGKKEARARGQVGMGMDMASVSRYLPDTADTYLVHPGRWASKWWCVLLSDGERPSVPSSRVGMCRAHRIESHRAPSPAPSVVVLMM